jgi:hypothetical protein
MRGLFLTVIFASLASCGGGGGGGATTETAATSTTTNSTLQFGNTTLGNAKFSQ